MEWPFQLQVDILKNPKSLYFFQIATKTPRIPIVLKSSAVDGGTKVACIVRFWVITKMMEELHQMEKEFFGLQPQQINLPINGVLGMQQRW